MVKAAQYLTLALFMVLAFAAPAMAQENPPAEGTSFSAADGSAISFSGAFGAGLVTIGAALGIGKLAAAAVESMARQPEVAGTVQISMIIAAALIEGFTFFALVICNGQNPWPAAG